MGARSPFLTWGQGALFPRSAAHTAHLVSTRAERRAHLGTEATLTHVSKATPQGTQAAGEEQRESVLAQRREWQTTRNCVQSKSYFKAHAGLSQASTDPLALL